VVFDFDGVFTTNEVIVSETGEESVVCNRSDGYGMRLLTAQKLDVLILSTETNPVVQARAKKLALECHQNCADKAPELRRLMEARDIPLSQVAYVGNDVNDLGCFALAGLSIAVADAFPEVKKAAHWVLKHGGGRGAVREVCELVYAARESLPQGESPWSHFLKLS
jgi:3-deoxy-D-manno-octulosonate 8-phosphate phosphatase (KDO 8-P phosphatase)